MRMSSDEAWALLSKYSEESTPVKVSFVARAGIVTASVTGILGRIPPSHIMVRSEDKKDFIYFPFAGCEVEYGDVREAPDSIKEDMANRYESAMTIFLPPFSGDRQRDERLYIFEVRTSS